MVRQYDNNMFSNPKQFSSFLLVVFVFFICIIFKSTYADTVTCTLGNSCSASPEVLTVSAIVGGLPSIDPGSGGGGVYKSGVRFSGLAYPGAIVTVLKRDNTTLTVIADNKGAFTIFVPENNWQLFTLFATDTAGRKSTLLNFPTVLYAGVVTDISGIRFAPTITTDKIAVKKGDYLTIEGASLPNDDVEVAFEGNDGRTFSLASNNLGVYNITIPADFSEGEYVLRARYEGDTRTSKAIKITVGTATILRVEAVSNIPGDCNFDQRVTLVDFSVLAFWYSKTNPPKCVDANTDGIINLVDFSILAFYWNG